MSSTTSTRMTKLLEFLNLNEREKCRQFGEQLKDETYTDLLNYNATMFERFLNDDSTGFTTEDTARILYALQLEKFFLEQQIYSNPVERNIAKSAPRYAVKIYKWPLNIGDVVRNVLESVSTNIGKPIKLYHVGVVVYNTLHHFNGHGLQQHLEMPASNTDHSYQITNKSRNDFDHWLHENSHNYTVETYHFASKNCISFSRAVCEFLGDEVLRAFEAETEVNDLQKLLKDLMTESTVFNMISGLYQNNSINQLFSSGGILVKSGSNSNSSMENVRTNMTNIMGAMELNFNFSKTGGLYDTSLGAEVD